MRLVGILILLALIVAGLAFARERRTADLCERIAIRVANCFPVWIARPEKPDRAGAGHLGTAGAFLARGARDRAVDRNAGEAAAIVRR